MKKRRQRAVNETKRRIFKMLVVQTVFIVLATIGSYVFVDVMAKIAGTDSVNLTLFAILIPMCVVLGLLNYIMSKYVYKYVFVLSEGMRKVSDGDFSVRLDEGKGGPLGEVYVDFNKMCAELENVEMLKNDFLNNYAHELKTPITSINGFARLLMENDVTEDERNGYLQLIADESKRLAAFANSTMLMSKLDAQSIVVDKEEYDIGEQLRQSVILLSGEWGGKNINVDGGEIRDVAYNGNQALMQEVWYNLISNAIKYTPRGGEIKLGVAEDGADVVVTVSDTGAGMDEETLAHIFEKYYQGDKSHSSKGLGLGLAIAERIVRLCDGTIEVKSEPNVGSTFTVRLPK